MSECECENPLIVTIYYLIPGAAGLDSSIFAHLKRNWTWNNSANYRKGDKLASPPFIMSEVAESGRCVSVNTTKGKTKVNPLPSVYLSHSQYRVI